MTGTWLPKEPLALLLGGRRVFAGMGGSAGAWTIVITGKSDGPGRWVVGGGCVVLA